MHFVYILANRSYGTLQIGMTDDLSRPINDHRDAPSARAPAQNAVKRLVWYESHDSIEEARRREETLKRLPRRWMINLIERGNPQWADLLRSAPPDRVESA